MECWVERSDAANLRCQNAPMLVLMHLTTLIRIQHAVRWGHGHASPEQVLQSSKRKHHQQHECRHDTGRTWRAACDRVPGVKQNPTSRSSWNRASLRDAHHSLEKLTHRGQPANVQAPRSLTPQGVPAPQRAACSRPLHHTHIVSTLSPTPCLGSRPCWGLDDQTRETGRPTQASAAPQCLIQLRVGKGKQQQPPQPQTDQVRRPQSLDSI